MRKSKEVNNTAILIICAVVLLVIGGFVGSSVTGNAIWDRFKAKAQVVETSDDLNLNPGPIFNNIDNAEEEEFKNIIKFNTLLIKMNYLEIAKLKGETAENQEGPSCEWLCNELCETWFQDDDNNYWACMGGCIAGC